MRGVNRRSIPIARKLRRLSTSAESRLWAELRNRQLGKFKFVRQEPVGEYIGDFVCREARLIIEVDGATHSTEEEMRRDASRTASLEALGYKVIRVQNDDVYNAMEGVLDTLLAALASSAK
ncbi:MAG: endonuclease domain-containing protein [Pseudomonadota bacterium]